SSKKFMAFVGTCTALAGLISRDNMLSKENLHKVQSKVAHLALEPMDSHELPRKVTVYLTPPIGDGIYKTRAHFKEYVKVSTSALPSMIIPRNGAVLLIYYYSRFW